LLILQVTARTPDGLPHVGTVPGKTTQFIASGFNGHGMPVVFLAAKGVAEMVLGKTFEQTNIPKLFKTTEARLQAMD
jgi:glycine/D-amino acid oxidase-like deaminating enzyme